MSVSSDEERVRLALREMLAVGDDCEASTDPSLIRKEGGWRWRQRIDLKVVVAVAAAIILLATLVWASPLRPGPTKQRVITVTPTTSSPSTSLPDVTTVPPTTVPPTTVPTTTTPTTAVPIDTAVSVYGDCTNPSVEPEEIVLACADHGAVLTALQWTSWTATSATAVGTLVYNDCTPDCAGGQYHNVPDTSVTLTVPIHGAGGNLVWSEVQESPEPPGYATGPYLGGPQPLPTQPD